MRVLNVDLGQRSYPIYIADGLLAQSELLKSHILGKQVLIVTNETVGPLYMDKVVSALSGLQVDTLVLPDGENYKNLDTLNQIFDQLLTKKHNRSTTLLALGGGVVGDMTGFAAACYQRGVKFLQVPTTLLAQVDSSVGGKTGVNHRQGKNMIGAFHQPEAVFIDTSTLSSLPARELRAGLAEVIKYGLICDQSFFVWLQQNYEAILNLDKDAMVYVIERSCRNKADVVSQDERESGIRAILNLGHTFGHAIETFQGYREWLHGEAVAVGMVMAADLSYRLGWLTLDQAQQAKVLISAVGLPVCPPEKMEVEHFLEFMSVDKKVLDGQLRLVLLDSVGRAVVTSDFAKDKLLLTLKAGAQLCQ